MVLAALLGAAIVGLIALYLTQPVYREFRLAAARFFEEEPRSNQSRLQISLRSLLLSPPFYLQLAVLMTLMAAMILTLLDQGIRSPSQQIAVWVVVDTSGSMSVPAESGNRFDIALHEVGDLMLRLDTFPPEVQRCVSLFTFDMSIEQIADNIGPATVTSALSETGPRALGTDVNLIRQLLVRAASEDLNCTPTHVIIYSDLPAPDLIVESETFVIWQVVGSPADNVGLTSIRLLQGLLPGVSQGLDVAIVGYGNQVVGATLIVTDQSGRDVLNPQPLEIANGEVKQISIPLSSSGRYTLRIEPGGAYLYDDQATVDYDAGEVLRVDWELSDRTLPEILGWRLDETAPQLRVAAYPSDTSPEVPTLLVGDDYGKSPEVHAIDFFVEKHPLIADLNLDVAESLQIRGLSRSELGALSPVLFDTAGLTWFAASDEPRIAFVPGLPTAVGDADIDAFSATAFFNALRFLLQIERTPLACQQTSPTDPIPDADHCALHPDESNTVITGSSLRSISDISPTSAAETQKPIGPWLMIVALVLVIIERSLGAFGGPAWR